MAGAAARTSDEDWKRGIELGHRNRAHQRSNPKGKMGGIALGQQGGWHGGSWREDPWLLVVDLVAAAQFLL